MAWIFVLDDLIGNKIADKTTNASNNYLSRSQNDDVNGEIKEPKKRYISAITI